MPDVGLVVDEVEFAVEEGKLREFALAAGDAEGDGVPLTFTAVAGHWRDQAAMVDLLGLDLRRIVVGGSEWEYHAQFAAGDRLRGRRVLTAREEKQGARGAMTILTLETRFHRQDGELAVVQRDTVIELPQ
ncbi:MAG TPA: MaoC family dehydratase N-terminal domain-containing protein [Thermoleophilaceae bacterium]|nr:MaoC family dehydratase N-terminal domain-containing protein [Thermoleophilaceae bacterium]